ncbi:bifunctional farnesyl-diphosphate farnesyltransferase/squalene synthase KNAG_0K00660 [Huiozyma naganishii CBS 8797]|uniref:Squalene synthase n=1 Tax=Huiozyma naganishii (strain ATCC MYA-139 / BCRC 22969 / CBS 8797 / KCTC 17520 / NBRC 10181 / NCYC 3082 / Yp74L-3) TaxID=1071383 RepID=J7SA23_HUIN7|nr:hypothetical protein KNAG_0K00660 [Kazachstania naganishii CBS 8797]CCK72434.1 hypothetical protein KNAG_0K00660 [Kazachstania naganishii CBS 8797]
MKVSELLLHPAECIALVQFKFVRKPLFSGVGAGRETADLARCRELLRLTSRSFAAVIMELHPELRDCVMLFYLVLRALDTVEDDMTIDDAVKVPLLRSFDEKLLLDDWSFDGNSPQEKDRCVLVEFPCILREFHKLRAEYRDVVVRITREMGNGMADYIEDEQFNREGIQTVAEYDRYCHYVAGLVGDGLTQLTVLAGFSSQELADNPQYFESMGLFLQKTNIIRDYREDLDDGRVFWPKAVWSKYTKEQDGTLAEFASLENTESGVFCINDLVLNALDHIEDVLTYLASVHEQSSFQFCAIPQVMAIATLALLCNNAAVLQGNVKIRKGTTCWLILRSRTFRGCVEIFEEYLREIRGKVPVRDPNYLKFNVRIGKIDQFIEELYQSNLPEGIQPRKTPIYLKVSERTKYDDKVAPTIQAEQQTIQWVLVTCGSLVAALIVGYLMKR